MFNYLIANNNVISQIAIFKQIILLMLFVFKNNSFMVGLPLIENL